MAVEARHMNLLASHFVTNREGVKSQPNMNYNNGQIEIAGGFPVTIGDRKLPYIQSRAIDLASFNKSESDLTYNFYQTPAPRAISKRQRDSTFDSGSLIAAQKRRPMAFNASASASLIDAELVSQMQQQQSEIDRFVAQQTETLRFELEARQRTQTLMLESAIQTAIIKKLKTKDDEIVRIEKLNWVLF